MSACTHNQRERYTNGFYCEDCKEWFAKDSATYRSSEYLSELWMALHNINAGDGKQRIEEVDAMRDEIGIGKEHEDYEKVIAKAEAMLDKYDVAYDSAVVVLEDPTF